MEKPKLFSTTEQDGHIHVVYQNSNGEYEMYESNKHIHFVRKIDALPIEVDDKGNVSREPTQEAIEVEPYENHSHEILPIVSTKKKTKTNKVDVVKEFYALYSKAYDISDEFIGRADVAYNFYVGGDRQWCLDREAERLLRSRNRAVISTNEIQPIINSLSGTQRQNRTEMKAFSTETGDPMEADIASTVLKHISQSNRLNSKGSKVFKTAIITGRGDIGIDLKTVNSIAPEIKLTKEDYQDVFYGPHEDELLEDCEYLFKRKWVSYSTLERQFPSKKAELKTSHNYFAALNSERIDFRADEVNNEKYVPFNHVSGTALYDQETRKYQVLKLERKVYSTVPIAVVEEDDMDNLYQSLEGVDPEIISAVKKASAKGDVKVINHTKYQMEVILMAGDTVLKQFVHNIPEFSSLPLYANKEKGYTYGIIEPVIPHQREINKRHSQAIDSTIFNNGNAWGYDDDTFANTTEEQNFVKRSNDPSLVVKLQNVEKPPIKIQSERNFKEPVEMLELASRKMKSVSGVNMEQLGNESNARSGIAIARRLRQGLVINDFIFDNESDWKQKLGVIILLYVQEYFSTDDIMKILLRENGKSKLKLGGQKYADLNPEIVRGIIDNMDFTKYDIVISESASSPTRAMDLLAALTELTQAGQLPQSPMITIDVLKNSGLIDPQTADKYMEEIKAQQEAERQLEQGKQDTEVTKAKIANPEQK